MTRTMSVLATLLLTTPLAAQREHDLPGHVDTYVGAITVRPQYITPSHPGVVVLADGQQFLFQTEAPQTFAPIRGDAVLQYWHTGLRITLAAARRVLELRVTGERLPRELGRARYGTTRLVGVGLVQRQGALPGVDVDTSVAGIAGLESSDYCEWCPFYPDEGDQGGGGGSCEPRSCSVGCSNGSQCSVSCSTPNFRASCACTGGQPVCTCVSCR